MVRNLRASLIGRQAQSKPINVSLRQPHFSCHSTPELGGIFYSSKYQPLGKDLNRTSRPPKRAVVLQTLSPGSSLAAGIVSVRQRCTFAGRACPGTVAYNFSLLARRL